MACSCKRKLEFESKYGVKETETLFAKYGRYLFRVFALFLLILIAIVVVPIMVVTVVYKIAFGKELKIVLPKFLGKYLK